MAPPEPAEDGKSHSDEATMQELASIILDDSENETSEVTEDSEVTKVEVSEAGESQQDTITSLKDIIANNISHSQVSIRNWIVLFLLKTSYKLLSVLPRICSTQYFQFSVNLPMISQLMAGIWV